MVELSDLIGTQQEPSIERYKCIAPGCTNFIAFGPRDEEFYKKKGWVDGTGNVVKPKRCKFHREEAKRFREKQIQQLSQS